MLVISHAYNSFQKDSIEKLANFLKCIYVFPRYNPIANIGRWIPFSSLDRFSLRSKLDLEGKPENVNVMPTSVLYAPLDREYKNLGRRHYRVVKKLIDKKKINFDLVHAHFIWSAGYVATRLKTRYKVPCVVTAHGFDAYSLPFKDDEWRGIVKEVLENSDYITTVSEKNSECIKKLNVKTPVEVIPNGYRKELFYPIGKEECRKKLKLPVNKKIILSVGNFEKIKGHSYLIEALKIVKKERRDIFCAIVGSGREYGRLRKLIKKHELEDSVIMVGRRPHSQIPIWMNAADIFVLPSLNEGNPTVMFEALGVGLPFVGTKVGGIPEIITCEDYGLLAEPQNIENLAEKILFGFEKRWDIQKIQQYGKRFTCDKAGQRMLEIYKELMQKRN